MPETLPTKPSSRASRKSQTCGISDIDEKITGIFRSLDIRPSRELVVKIREAILKKAIAEITPSLITPYLQEQIAKLTT
jgi:hypothetical protein